MSQLVKRGKRTCSTLFAGILLGCVIAFAPAAEPQTDGKSLPVDDEIKLVVLHTEFAIRRYKPLLDEQASRLGGEEMVFDDRKTISEAGAMLTTIKGAPRRFNGPDGFALIEMIRALGNSGESCSATAATTALNQLWVADITYIRLQREFIYLAMILDGFSRKVVGWQLDRTLAVRLPLTALEQAIAGRKPGPGVVHHSDRGLQYASDEYVAVLRQQQMIPSMSRPTNPYDNASCESFIKTLKREEISANEYENLGTFAKQLHRIHRAVLQRETAAVCVGLSLARRVRGASQARRRGLNNRCYSEILPAIKGR